jgi:regulator of nonsense transcripts 3
MANSAFDTGSCYLHLLPPFCSVKRTVLSRAYINFSSPQDVAEFAAKFDGHTFIGARGQQYKCTVEYAPFQKIPAAGAKRAPMEGTIDKGGP